MLIEKANYTFSDYSKLNNHNYGCQLRSFEIDTIFRMFNFRQFKHGLELGCGDGTQSGKLLLYCDSLISTDMNLSRIIHNDNNRNVEFQQLDAQDLSELPDNHFDMIFSSNLLEHLHNVEDCLSHCFRITKTDSIIIHAVPNRIWKVFNYILYYPVHFIAVLNKIFNVKRNNEDTIKVISNSVQLDDNLRPIVKKSFLSIFLPHIHGISKTHMREFIDWQEKKRIVLFEKFGFEVIKIVRLPFYYGYGLQFKLFHIIGNLIRLSSSTCFILKKTTNTENV